jgi:tripartite-type tricarboxylate transporter receptor subunit TctC
LDVLPGVPTVDEFVPGYEAGSWYGVGALKGTFTKIIEKLNKEIDAVVAEPNVKARLVGLGLRPREESRLLVAIPPHVSLLGTLQNRSYSC